MRTPVRHCAMSEKCPAAVVRPKFTPPWDAFSCNCRPEGARGGDEYLPDPGLRPFTAFCGLVVGPSRVRPRRKSRCRARALDARDPRVGGIRQLHGKLTGV